MTRRQPHAHREGPEWFRLLSLFAIASTLAIFGWMTLTVFLLAFS